MAGAMTYASYPIFKTEETPDGLLVYGRATDGSVDSDEQIVDPDWSAKAVQDWLTTGGNVRVQHNPQLLPAGKGLEVEINRDGDGGHWVKSLVVEPTAAKLVKAGVLTAYSVGISRPQIKPDVTGKARGGIITGDASTSIAEISLVDRPANRNCSITVCKNEDDQAPWSYGDLEALLAKAETKAAETDTGGDPDSETEDKPDPNNNDAGEQTTTTDDEARKMFDAARTTWLAEEPTLTASSNGTDFLAKRAAWQEWDRKGNDEGFTDTTEGFLRWLAKRDFEPNVGGGVDRDKLEDSDFVFPDERKFPVVKPGDVADAVSSWGRYKGEKTFEQFRSRLKALCARKGGPFEKALPDAWGASGDGDKSKGEGVDAVKASTPPGPPSGNPTPPPAPSGTPTPPGPGPATPGEHREPDGTVAEQLEDDLGVQEPGENEPPDRTPPAAMKTVEPTLPYSVMRMHDAVCPGHLWATVKAAYPSLTGVGDALDVAWLTEQVSKSLDAGDMVAVGRHALAAVGAQQLRGVEPEQLADARAVLKGLPPAPNPQPGDNNPGPVPTGATSARIFYTRAQLEQHRNVMRSLHDHIAGAYPDLCPLAGAGGIPEMTMEVDEAADVLGMEKGAEAPKPCGPSGSTILNPAGGGEVKKSEATLTVVPDVEAIRTAVAEAAAELVKGATAHLSELVESLTKRIDFLESQPDPTQAPIRGVVSKAAAAAPVERRSLAGEAVTKADSSARGDYVAYLRGIAASHPNPTLRLQAEQQLSTI